MIIYHIHIVLAWNIALVLKLLKQILGIKLYIYIYILYFLHNNTFHKGEENSEKEKHTYNRTQLQLVKQTTWLK